MTAPARAALGSVAGTAVAAFLAPLLRGLFSPPSEGVGWVTVNAYPKGWDYAVVALLFAGAAAGGALLARRGRAEPAAILTEPAPRPRPLAVLAGAILVFVTMLFIHDHPYAHMDAFHEGEHLTAGWLMKSGLRPYRDFFVFHGLAVDAGLDALTLGDPPSPLGPRRLQTVLDAATLALLVPIAAEVTVSVGAMSVGVMASLCAVAAFWLPVFPYFRLAPLFVAVWALLRFVRSGRRWLLFAAMSSSTLGLLWSFDTGTYAVAGTAAAIVLLWLMRRAGERPPIAMLLLMAAVAALLPFLLLLLVRADVGRFLVDSFVILPRTIDATWALAAPTKLGAEALRYYLPPVFYGFLAALGFIAWRRGDPARAARIAIVVVFSLLLFRTAAGRVGWSHTRFALPLLGIAIVAFVLEPLLRGRRWIPAALIAAFAFVHMEIAPNLTAGMKLLSGWSARQRHEGMVRHPLAPGIYTSEQNAMELASLKNYVDALGPAEETILDFSNERALYYLLKRRPAVRCMEISMLSVPRLLSEAMAQLEARPPVCVIVEGDPAIASFDGVPNRTRVPALAAWIDENYPRRTQIGRFVVATR